MTYLQKKSTKELVTLLAQLDTVETTYAQMSQRGCWCPCRGNPPMGWLTGSITSMLQLIPPPPS